jgi:hypothetical protein
VRAASVEQRSTIAAAVSAVVRQPEWATSALAPVLVQTQ